MEQETRTVGLKEAAMLAAILLFAGVALFMLFGRTRPGDSTRALVRTMRSACDQYRLEFGEFPPVAFGDSRDLHLRLGMPYVVMVKGREEVVTKRPYVDFPSRHILPTRPPYYIQDEWDRSIEYRNPGERDKGGVDLWSLGPKAADPADDICSWLK